MVFIMMKNDVLIVFIQKFILEVDMPVCVSHVMESKLSSIQKHVFVLGTKYACHVVCLSVGGRRIH